MADSDKNIIITPNRGLSGQPEIYFGGSGGVPIRMKVLDDSFGTLSWEGSAGQLFSINNNLTSGSIFSVNDVSGIPSIEVNADGTVTLAPYGGNVGIGVTAPNTLLHVGGTVSASGFSGPLLGNATTATTLATSRNFSLTGDVTASAVSFNGGGHVQLTTAIAAGSIVNADSNASAAIADTKLATISTAGKVSNSATTATNANTANAIVARDGSGNFSAGTITASLTGTASNATQLGGTAAASWALLASPTFTGTPSAPTATSGTNTTQIATTQFVRTEVSNLVASAPTTLDTLNELATALGNDPNFATTVTTALGNKAGTTGGGASGTWGISVTGNASTATTLANSRNFSLTGDVTASAVSFNGGGNVQLTTAIAAGSIVNADISASAAIATSKLAANTISGVALGSNLNTLTIGTGLGGSSYNGSSAVTITNTGVLSFNGSTGAIQGVGSVVAGSNITISPTGGTGAVTINATVPTVNNGTLTLNTSGNGISGTQTFTANQSGNSTFTVTSNATSANTVNAIVSRDGSGNFSAGTITAALTGNASTATTLANSRNFSLTGDVTASAVSFNGGGNVQLTTAIAAGSIVNADISASAAIATSKLAANTISGVALGNNLNTLTIGTGLGGSSYNGSSAVTITNNGVTSFNGLTGAVGGVCAAQANTFTALQTFTTGISAAGATLSGTLSATSVVATNGFQVGSGAINAQTAGHTLAASDNGKIVTINSASPVTLTVGTAVGTTGFSCTVIQVGTGQVTIAGSSTTLNSFSGLKMLGQYSGASIVCYATNTFSVIGGLTS